MKANIEALQTQLSELSLEKSEKLEEVTYIVDLAKAGGAIVMGKMGSPEFYEHPEAHKQVEGMITKQCALYRDRLDKNEENAG